MRRNPVRLKEMLVDPSESPYDVAVHEENRARVEAALAKVPEPFRTTLILRDIEGFVYEEVAEMQGVNLGTVKSRLVRGRAWLKALLTAQSPATPPHMPGSKCPWERRRDERLQCNESEVFRVSGRQIDRTGDAAYRAHLDRCRECAAEWTSLREVQSSLACPGGGAGAEGSASCGSGWP